MRMQAFALTVALALAVTAFGLPASGQGAVRVLVNGDMVMFDQPPVIQGSRVLVPLRGIFERMGASVEWRPAARTVLAAHGSTLVELQIGSRIARINGSAVTLDVPAMIIGGRTLVPLRFVSESLGADVQWHAASRTVVITSAGATPVQPPPVVQPPPQQPTTVSGVITNIIPAQSAQDQARIVIRADNVSTTVRITTETAITRVETSSGAGGSVGLAALRPGDEVRVTLADGDVASHIRASYMMTSGRIEAVATGSRTIVLHDGRTIRYSPNIMVLANGQIRSDGVGALRSGQVIELRLNPSSRVAWEANIITGAAQQPGQMTLTVSEPDADETVGSPVRVVGRTAPGSRVDIAVTWFLGIRVGGTTVKAGQRGRFNVEVPFNVVAPNSPYMITVTATHSQLGTEQVQIPVTVTAEAGR